MKLSIYTQDLMRGLGIATRGLAAKPPNAVMEAIQMEATGDGVKMTGMDGVASFTWTGAAESVGDPGEALLPGKLLADLVRKLPEGLVRITTDDRSATIVCGKSKSKLALVSGGAFPDVKGAKNPYTFAIAQGALRKMINRAAPCLSTDQTRLVLTGMLMAVTADEVRVVTLDGFRMCVNRTKGSYILPEGKTQVKAVVPGRVMTEIGKIMDDSEKDCIVQIGDSRIEFVMDEVRVTCALLTGEFVDYERLIPQEFKTEALMKTDAIQDAVGRCGLMAKEGKNNLIRMNFDGDAVKISSMAEMGDVEEEADVDLRGEPIRIAFNSRYLMELFRMMSDECITMRMNTSASPCIITPQEGNEWTYMLLPVRTM